jgi:hypothetical protein
MDITLHNMPALRSYEMSCILKLFPESIQNQKAPQSQKFLTYTLVVSELQEEHVPAVKGFEQVSHFSLKFFSVL